MGRFSRNVKLITIVEMPEFTKQAEDFLSEEEIDEIKNFLAAHPEAGEIISGAGGIRKCKVAAKGKGKSHGGRVIYYYHNDDMPLYLLTAYPKSDKDDLTASETRVLRALVSVLVKQSARRQA